MADKLVIVNASITMLRADGHSELRRNLDNATFIDCLHICSPIIDWWNLILYNALMSLKLPLDPVRLLPDGVVEEQQQTLLETDGVMQVRQQGGHARRRRRRQRVTVE